MEKNDSKGAKGDCKMVQPRARLRASVRAGIYTPDDTSELFGYPLHDRLGRPTPYV